MEPIIEVKHLTHTYVDAQNQEMTAPGQGIAETDPLLFCML